MHKLLLLSFIALIGVQIDQKPAWAQDIAPQPCDPQFYSQMQSRAWLESEREIMQNQNLIFKADSVLEYTCFDRWANVAAWPAGDIFTHTEYFGEQIIERSSPYALDTSIENIVYEALDIYRDDNFEHSLLGGRGEHVGLEEAPGTEFEPVIDNPLPYECTVMADVWRVAKCLNFVHNEEFVDKDGYYPFETIACGDNQDNCEDIAGYDEITDTRQYPEGMECESESELTDWAEQIEFAENQGEVLYEFQTPLGEIFLDVFERTVPGECTDGILTGVQVVLAAGPAHEDGVCSNPGCTFAAGGGCD